MSGSFKSNFPQELPGKNFISTPSFQSTEKVFMTLTFLAEKQFFTQTCQWKQEIIDLLLLTVWVSRSVMSSSLQPHGLQSTRLLCPCKSPGKNSRMGSHSILQRIFLTQGLNPGLLHGRQILYCWATRELMLWGSSGQKTLTGELIQAGYSTAPGMWAWSWVTGATLWPRSNCYEEEKEANMKGTE